MDQPSGPIELYHHQIVKAIEVSLFAGFGLLFYEYGPFWIWHDAINASMTVVVILGCFVLYVAVRGQRSRRSESHSEPISLGVGGRTASQFQVPRRFSLRAIIILTLIFAVFNVTLQALDAPPLVAILLMSFAAIVATMQAIMERIPRFASSIVGVAFGACLFPNSPRLVKMVELVARANDFGLIEQIIVGAFLGAFVGYAIGVFAAGVFLIGDSFEKWWRPPSPA